MKKSPYSRFDCNDLILRDELAVDPKQSMRIQLDVEVGGFLL
jgi:hypothetical protein